MIKSVCFAVLAVCSVCAHMFIDRYEVVGPDLLRADWQVAGANKQAAARVDNGQISLASTDGSKHVSVRQVINGYRDWSRLRVSAQIRYSDVVPGPKAYNRARLLLVQNDGIKDRWDVGHTAASVAGTAGWEACRQTFEVLSAAKKIQIIAQLSRCTGSFELKDVHVFPVEYSAVWIWTGRVLVTAWGGLGLLLIGNSLLRADAAWILKAAAITAFCFVVVGTCMPGEVKKETTRFVVEQVDSVAGSVKTGLPRDYSKLGHFVFFIMLGTGFCLVMRGTDSPAVVYYNVLLVAGGTELVQFFIEGRSPMFRDFLVDSVGGLVGILLCSKLRGAEKCLIGKKNF